MAQPDPWPRVAVLVDEDDPRALQCPLDSHKDLHRNAKVLGAVLYPSDRGQSNFRTTCQFLLTYVEQTPGSPDLARIDHCPATQMGSTVLTKAITYDIKTIT